MNFDELEFRGIEKGDDGKYRAMYADEFNNRLLIGEQELRNARFRLLRNREDALHALEQSNPVEWPAEIDAA